MEITYLGVSSFKLKGKSVTLVTDPFDSQATGLKFPHTKAEIVTVSHNHADHNATGNIDDAPFIVSGPGEYEIQDVSIEGFPGFHDDEKGAARGRNTVYHIHMDGINILHCGDMGVMPTSEEIDAFGTVDVLMVPVGGVYTIDAATAQALTRKIEPSIVLPMHYHTSHLNQETYGTLAPVSAFLTELGVQHVEPQQKISLKQGKLPEEVQVVVFE